MASKKVLLACAVLVGSLFYLLVLALAGDSDNTGGVVDMVIAETGKTADVRRLAAFSVLGELLEARTLAKWCLGICPRWLRQSSAALPGDCSAACTAPTGTRRARRLHHKSHLPSWPSGGHGGRGLPGGGHPCRHRALRRAGPTWPTRKSSSLKRATSTGSSPSMASTASSRWACTACFPRSWKAWEPAPWSRPTCPRPISRTPRPWWSSTRTSRGRRGNWSASTSSSAAGGSLLVMGEHTVREKDGGSRINDVLAPTAMRVPFDSALFAIGGWLHSYDALAHPTSAGIGDEVEPVRRGHRRERGGPLAGPPALGRPLGLGRPGRREQG